MSSEQTWLSKKLSPAIEEYSVVDVAFIGATIITLAALFTPAIHPLVGVALGWGFHFALKTFGFYTEEGRSPLKNGTYTEIVEHRSATCTDCGEEYKDKTGYKMVYLLGYELFRIEQFHSFECEVCEMEMPEDKGERDAEKVKELA